MKHVTSFLTTRQRRNTPLTLRRLMLGGVMVLGLVAGQAFSDSSWETLHGEVREGDVVPLETILDWLEARYIGEVLEVEVEREGNYVEYEIKLLGPQNQVVEFEFDGQTGQLMKMEGVRINDMRRPQ
ncbi:PepSY domain-containing protein [Halomonas sp. SH5A2]|uniref:PepSY domain-containing protein n=1 Tax=Halomonas sp. SH5A2 TaxID=2749040 RepID=UPI00163F14A9|nr:PepSY domain-containing protein [Halomonas sp. SH5A2]QNI01678.1 PepSY domain-containing protein [Halomonas sp. SH5A2]